MRYVIKIRHIRVTIKCLGHIFSKPITLLIRSFIFAQYNYDSDTQLKLFNFTFCILETTGENIVFEHTYKIIYINKGCNFIITIVHSALAKKSLSKSFLGLQLFGFRLSQTETFFFPSQLNFLKYKNLKITNLKRKLFELAKICSGDKGSFTMLS